MQENSEFGVETLPDDVARLVRDDGRRAVLRGFEALGQEPDADFDRLTGIASTLMQAPVSIVSLVDVERQWFKSCTGFDGRETPVGMSFCAHAIAASDVEVLVIEDASMDPRFAANPLVVGEQHVRFYAGAPITISGARIGTLCVLDRAVRPRPDDTQLDQLKSLAAIAASLFQLKDNTRKGTLARAALVREEKRHALALEAATIASWVWDVGTDMVECDALLPVLFNLPHATRIPARDIFFAIDRRDVTRAEARLRDALTESDDYSGEYRVNGVNPPRWLAARGRVIERDAEGRPALVFGVNFDITERRSQEERQRLLLRELNHRVKNTLATVQALATQTVRHAREPRAFLEAFTARLQALGMAHGLLSDHEWRGIGMKELVKIQVMPFDTQSSPRVLLKGDDVYLTPDQALALGLMLHELASNALYYGSLSVPEGAVDLSWNVVENDAMPRLEIVWNERGGPTVIQPPHHGFGSILIRRSLDKVLSSSVNHEFLPEGVRAEISIPLEQAA